MSSYPPSKNKKSTFLGNLFPWFLLVAVMASFGWYVFNNEKTKQVTATSEDNKAQLEERWKAPKAEEDKFQMVKKPTEEVVSYHQAVAKASQSVVNIYTTQRVSQNPYMNDPILRRFFDQQKQDNTNLGSGVIVSEDGYIVTNAHVIEQANEITVSLNDGRKGRAKVVGTDPESDLAVIKVDIKGLKPLAFRENPIQVGDVALAIGNPFGVGQTVTQGIISATGRSGLGVNTFEDFIQTDAAINPGNSGGALVDAYGELVGINTMIFSRSGGSMGIGFAIPTVIVEQVMSGLIEKGHVSRGWLGIEVQSQLQDPTSLESIKGVMVMRVIPNSPAANSGLLVGDVILNIDGTEMSSANALVKYVSRKSPNTTLNAEVIRNGETVNVPITLAERPSQSDLRTFTVPRSKEGDDNNNQAKNQLKRDSDARNFHSNPSTSNLSEAQKEQLRRELMDFLNSQ